MLILVLLLVSPAWAEELHGRVMGIADGDTLTLLVNREQVRVRLAEIDTPELHQPWGSRARQSLSAIAFQQTATVVVQDIDRYGRTVGRVYVGALDVNAELVRRGDAGYIANMHMTRRCCHWRLRRGRHGADFGRCQSPSGCRPGCGADCSETRAISSKILIQDIALAETVIAPGQLCHA
jgi:endonuclease YncB( thermonuclease family)